MITQKNSDWFVTGRQIVVATACGCWLLADVAAAQMAPSRRAPTPTVYKLNYADAGYVAGVLASLATPKDGRIAANQQANSVIVMAPPETHKRVQELIKLLDVPSARIEDGQLKVIRLVYTDPASAANILSSILDSRGTRIATDERTKSIVVAGPAETLKVAEALLLRLDTTADNDSRGTATTFQVRIVWLTAGPSHDDAADPADDLKGVVAELSKVGVKGLRQVAQAVVNTKPDGRFQIRCSPILNEQPVDLTISGNLSEQQAPPTLNIQLSASRQEQVPATPGTDAHLSERRLVDLQTLISAPYGHYVVLGVTPVGEMTSVFVVRVTPSKVE